MVLEAMATVTVVMDMEEAMVDMVTERVTVDLERDMVMAVAIDMVVMEENMDLIITRQLHTDFISFLQ